MQQAVIAKKPMTDIKWNNKMYSIQKNGEKEEKVKGRDETNIIETM